MNRINLAPVCLARSSNPGSKLLRGYSPVRTAHPTGFGSQLLRACVLLRTAFSTIITPPRRVRRAHRSTTSTLITPPRRAHHAHRPTHQSGFTLIELLVSVTLAALLITGLGNIVGLAVETQEVVGEKNNLTRQAGFAMEQMMRAASHTRRLMLPMPDKTSTTILVENIREQTNPPSAPPPGSSLASAVLAVTLPAYFDLDGNGVADADNDADGLIDEDLPADVSYDSKPGITGIDDDGDGVADDTSSPDADDDESADQAQDEDNLNGIDDDGDGISDEDPAADNNGDGCAGVCGVDDDADGAVDEGAVADDDEDGSSDEDWYDALVFYLDNGTLMQRTPVPWDEGGGGVSGLDYIVEPLAENVSRFRVERLLPKGNRPLLLDLTLELTSPKTGESVSLHSRIRVGGAL